MKTKLYVRWRFDDSFRHFLSVHAIERYPGETWMYDKGYFNECCISLISGSWLANLPSATQLPR
jgi:hypothetical protein